MKRLALFVLTLGLAFGVFAQRVEMRLAKNDTKTLQTEIQKHNAEKGLLVPTTVTKSSKYLSVKAAGCTITDISTAEDEEEIGNFTVTYTLTPNQGTGFFARALKTSQLDTLTDEDLKEEVMKELRWWQELYAYFGEVYDESEFWKTEGGEMELPNLKGKTQYTIVVMCVDPTDTVIVKENFTTPSSKLAGEPTMTVCEVKDIATTNAYLEVQKGPQTAYYYLIYQETARWQEEGIVTDEDVIADVTKNEYDYHKYREDSTWEIGDDDITNTYSLTPNTEYTLYLVACNGNGDMSAPIKKVFTTKGSEQSGEAGFDVCELKDIVSHKAYIEVKQNDQTGYYNLIFGISDTLAAHNLDSEDSVVAHVENYNVPKYTQDTTWMLGDDDLASSYALIPNTKYTVWAVPFNGNKEVGKVFTKEFTTPSSELSGVATFRTMEVEVLSDTSANVEFEKGDQTAYFHYFEDPKDTLLKYNQYELAGALEWLQYLIDYYERNGYDYPSFSIDTTITLGEDYALAKGTTYVVWGFPYNGNKELGEAKRVEFTTEGVGLAKIDFTAVNVYPNPATDKVVITSKKTIKNIEIVNTLGQVVYSKNANSDNVSIDVAKFDRGNYFVKVTTIDNMITAQQVVVK